MNPQWDAAQAVLGLALECLGDRCGQYERRFVDTSTPVADCDMLAVAIGNARAYSGSCVGSSQFIGNIDVHLIRCCEPVGVLDETTGYAPPAPEAIEAAAACIARDAWAILSCITCTGCDVLAAIAGVTACCDRTAPPPEIVFNPPAGGCRSAIVRIPMIFTTCCEDVAT